MDGSRTPRYGHIALPTSSWPAAPWRPPSGIRSTLEPFGPRLDAPLTRAASAEGAAGYMKETRERIHRGTADPRLLSAPPSRSRVADCDPNPGRLFGITSPSRVWNPLYRPLSDVCRPGHPEHADLTSSPPSSHFERGQFPMSARLYAGNMGWGVSPVTGS